MKSKKRSESERSESEKMKSKDTALKLQVALRCAKAAILLSSLKSFPNRHLTTSIDDQGEEKEMIKTMVKEIGDLKMELARERLKTKRIKLCGLMEVILQAGEYDKALLFYRNLNLTGLGLHGLASQAFDMFTEVLEKGLKPDESTFSALLCACCHAGLIEDGREIFRRMKEEFWIQARTEHYVHIVKLLGMAGELDEAYNFILSLKQPVDSGIWGALLSCCDAHGDYELAEIVAQQLFDGEPRKGAYRVMLSNIYAGDGKWVDVEKMRDYITTAGAEKMPGLSRIGSY